MAETTHVQPARLRTFVSELFCAAGLDPDEANITANVIVWTEMIGRRTHGMQRMPAYLNRLKRGLIASPCRPTFIEKAETVHVLDGGNGMGLVLGHLAINRAVDVADRYGVGVVGVRHSNHFLAGAYYVEEAAKQGKIGLATSNSFPRVAPAGGTTPVLGTNPFAFGAPTRNGHSILIDFSTGALAGGTIRQAIAQGQPLPAGLVVDDQGRDVTDPEQANHSTILPFGGAKGFCLGLMVEILSSVLTGAAMSHQITSFYNDVSRPSNLGHFFLALDITRFMPLDAYYQRLETLIGFLKAAKTHDDVDEILLPGETRWRTYQEQMTKGIQLDVQTVQSLNALAAEHRLPHSL